MGVNLPGHFTAGADYGAPEAGRKRRAEKEVRALVYRDALTGLPNRRLLEDRLASALGQAHRGPRALASGRTLRAMRARRP